MRTVMNKIIKALTTAAACAAAIFTMSATAFAEDYEFDVSSAAESNGSWGQSFIYYTANDMGEEHTGNFDTTWMTPDSEVLIEYTYSGETMNADMAPLELIWQTWDGGPFEIPEGIKTWNKVAPYEFDDTSAKFSFEDIAAAYGTDDFKTVYAICVGDTGVKLTVTKMTVTNCEITEAEEETEAEAEEETEAEAEEETEAETEEETEAETEEETEAETEETTVEEVSEVTTPTNIADNAPDEGGAGGIVVLVIIIVVVVAAIVVILIMMLKKSKGKYY